MEVLRFGLPVCPSGLTSRQTGAGGVVANDLSFEASGGLATPCSWGLSSRSVAELLDTMSGLQSAAALWRGSSTIPAPAGPPNLIGGRTMLGFGCAAIVAADLMQD
eukprot:jgi/Tetstr1/453083/TSEL_040118.t1